VRQPFIREVCVGHLTTKVVKVVEVGEVGGG